MNLKSIRALAITSAIVAGVAGAGVTAIHAAPNDAASRPNPMSNLITAISQKFNLNQADVQKVFEEQRTQMQQQMQAQHTEQLATRLTQAVKDGKLTQAQADLITAKQAELKTFHESLKEKTPEEARTALEAKRTELQTWAQANGIPEQYLMGPFAGGPRGEHGPRGGGRGAMGRGFPGGSHTPTQQPPRTNN